jgi:uncharacterized protein (DUF885 family)
LAKINRLFSIMKHLFLIAASAVVLASCGNNPKTETAMGNHASQDSLFDAYKQNFVENFWKIYPAFASNQGYHAYDSVLIVPNEESRQKELAFCKENLGLLKKLDLSILSDKNKTDYYMIENRLKSIEWSIDSLRSYEWDPSHYNVCEQFAEILNNKYDSLDTRLHNFYLKMKNIPAYYEAAKAYIKNPTLEHTQLAIDQNLGGVSVFETDLNEALTKSYLEISEKEQLTARAREASVAIKGYTAWLKNLQNETPRSFRLGKELYAKKFEYDIQSGYTAKEIYQKAIKHKAELHEQMFAITHQLWSKYLPHTSIPENRLEATKMMIDKLSLHHVKAEEFQTAIEHQIPLLVDFIKQKDLIYIDPSKPLVVRKEPAYMAGVAGASISAPGPYDKNGNTYYNVGSLSGWSKEQADSYLREYNHYILQILNIHEAIPGHYTQLVYANQSPSIIKAILANGAMIEGWAVYTERMMLENGYGNNEPEMWLMYYKWNLRTTCNTILDYAVHVNELSKEEAMHLLIDEAFQQQAEAEGKWKRVSVTQVQLCSYFTGYTEIYEFRKELKKRMGDKFNLKEFHEKFLSYGNAPVKYIKQLMLADLDKEKK